MNFIKVCRFEFLTLIKRKSFIITTIVMNLLIVITFLIPTFIDITSYRNQNFRYLLIDNSNLIDTNFFEENNKFILSKMKGNNVDENLYDGVIYLDSDLKLRLVPKNSNSYKKRDLEDLSKYLSVKFQESYIKSLNPDITDTEIDSILNITVPYTIALDNDGGLNDFITIILVITMFLMITCYCQSIAKSVIKEKNKRIIEILLTLINSRAIIFGKVIGYIGAVLFQLISLVIVTIICMQLFENDWLKIFTNMYNLSMPVLLSILFIFILSFIFYSFVYATIGTLAKKNEDLENSLTPIGILVTVIFFVILSALKSSNVTLLRVLSFIPFSTFGTMPIRILMNDVSPFDIVISIVIMMINIYFSGLLASRLYRSCISMRGMNLWNIFKNSRQKKYDISNTHDTWKR